MFSRKIATAALLLAVLAGCSRDPETSKRRWLASGNKYFEKGQYAQASIMYRRALKEDMRYGEAYYRLALTDLKLGRFGDAGQALRRAVELQPENVDAHVKLADFYLSAYASNPKRFKNLLTELRDIGERLLKRDPNSYDGLRIEGFLALAEGDSKTAEQKFRAANKMKPDEGGLVTTLAQVLFANKQPEEAEKLLKDLVAKQKSAAAAYNILYFHYLGQKRFEDAEKLLLLKATNNPDVSDFQIQLAEHYIVFRKPDLVKKVLDGLTADVKRYPDGFEKASGFYIRARQYEAAISTLEQGIKAQPEKKLQFQKLIVEVLSAQAKPAEALNLAESLLKEHPQDSTLLAMRATLWLMSGKREQLQTAIADMASAVSKMPRNPVLKFNYGRALATKGDFDAAKIQFQEALQIMPNYPPARLALAEVHLLKGEFVNVMQVAEDLLKQNPNFVPARLLRSSAHLGMKDFKQAKAELAETLKLVPQHRDAIYQMGRVQYEEKEYAQAERSFRQLYDMTPPDPRGLMGLTEVYMAQGRFEPAMELMRNEIKRSPKQLEYLVALGNIAVRAGRFDAAVEAYKSFSADRPKDGGIHLRLGEAYRRKGDFNKAMESFQRAVALMPANADPLLQLALLYETAGMRDQARPIYDQVLKLQPDNAIALNNVAFIMAEQGRDLDMALTLAQRAKQKAPGDPAVADTLGWVYIKKNLTDEALRVFQELTSKYPQNPTFQYHLGVALAQRGNKPEAKKALETALRNKPSKEEEGQIRQLLAR